MTQNRAETAWEINNCGKYINQFLPNTIKSIHQYERINKKICRQKMCNMFNEFFINEKMYNKIDILVNTYSKNDVIYEYKY